MSLPVNIDQYSRYITLSDDELLELRVNPKILERLHRLRGLYAYWLQFPTKFDQEIVQYDMSMFKVGRAQAYDDLHLVQLLLGNIQQAGKEFMRWKINKDLEEDLKKARRAGDFRSVAAIEKNRILNNRTDKDDEPEFEFDKIVPQNFEPTDDPSVIGIERVPDLRSRIKKLITKYSKDTMIEDAEYVEVEDDGTDSTE
ncbi:hypothetical protein HMPREF3034_00011 [Prevotella sp. DNF00663]|uniref:hypothetical protein n=1 Tax=Prevotella sp. DNF00663 TaxID=1384078 RepID=UPI000780BDCB|nr:hypothetical protein [Prevotella sp. DNF00663]KXB86063.1 hypothetical protein HMPREF3034_00011 [Prevotella sp. DNF00663]